MSFIQAVPLTGAAGQPVWSGGLSYRGVSVRNSHASDAAVVQVYDNAQEAAGTLLDTIALAAGASLSLVYDGIWASHGLYVAITGGTVEGSVRFG